MDTASNASVAPLATIAADAVTLAPPGGSRSSAAAEASLQRIPDTDATPSTAAVPSTSVTGTASHASGELAFYNCGIAYCR